MYLCVYPKAHKIDTPIQIIEDVLTARPRILIMRRLRLKTTHSLHVQLKPGVVFQKSDTKLRMTPRITMTIQ